MKRWLARGWEQLYEGAPVWILAMLISLTVTTAAGWALHGAGWSGKHVSLPMLLPSLRIGDAWIAEDVFSMTTRMLGLWLLMGLWRMAVTQLDGAPPRLEELARVSPLGFLQALLFTGALGAVGLVGTAVPPGAWEWGSWALLVGWFFLWVRLVFLLPLLAIGTPLVRASSISWRATSGRALHLAVFLPCGLALSLTGFLFLGVGVLFTAGLPFTGVAAAFHELCGPLLPEAADAEPAKAGA